MRKVVAKRRSIYNSSFFLSACALSLIRIPDYSIPYIDTILKVLLLILTFVSFVAYIKRRKISVIFIIISLYWLTLTIATLLNNGDYSQLAIATSSSLLLCMTLESGFSVDKRKTIKIFAIVLGIMAAINAATMYVYYNPLQSLRGMYVDGANDHNYYFLGQDNGTIFYSLPAALLVMLCSIHKKGVISKWAYIYTTYLGLAYVVVFSGAGIISFIALIVASLLFGNMTIRKKIINKLTINKIIIFLATVFLFVVVFRTENIVTNTIAQLLGKNLTYTGRTGIWDIVIGHISKRPMIGYGLQDAHTRLSMIPYGKAHNTILQIIYNGGFIAVTLFFYSIKRAFRKYKDFRNNANFEYAMILGYLIIIMIVGNFDFFIYHPFTFLPIILANLCTRRKIDKEVI